MGLDIWFKLFYSKSMLPQLDNQLKRQKDQVDASGEKRGELVNFVSLQFKELIKRKLQVPVKLYHL